MRKCVILGSGPAGCTAAIYIARAGFEPLVLEGPQPGGQLVITTVIENFPGFPEGILGADLVAAMREQAARFGAEFVREAAEEIDLSDRIGVRYAGLMERTESVIVATGASARWLGVAGERKLIGRGISACATCDAAFFRGKKVAIVGGGDSALTEAIFLTRFAEKVTLIHRRREFRAVKINVDKARENPKIDFVLDTVVEEARGDPILSALNLRNVKTGEVSSLEVDGLFVAIGHNPNTSFLKGKVDLDADGHVLLKGGFRTSVQGVFAAGDVADPVYRQAITAAGSGCQAAIETMQYLESKD